MFRVLIALALSLTLTACGSSHGTGARTATTRTSPAPAPATQTSSPNATPGPLQGEALATAAGDIPDNQVFVRYAGPTFSMKVPEGWARTGGHAQTMFRDKNNIARVVIARGAAPTVASAQAELASVANARVTKPPRRVRIGGLPAIALTYTTTSAPNAVTSKRVTLTVDRYELSKGGQVAIVDLGTPVGVDNVDAYRLMIESLRLQ